MNIIEKVCVLHAFVLHNAKAYDSLGKKAQSNFERDLLSHVNSILADAKTFVDQQKRKT
jgi:hypothetical protein